MANEPRRICGEVEKILFQNAENGYTVCLLSGEDGREYTLTGIMPALSVGERLSAEAVPSKHPVYGEQWRVTEFEKELPQDEASILRYLSSRALKGIGARRAEKIVQRFGADTLSVLENSPEMLTAIPGISPRLAKSIGEEFRAQFGLRQVLLFFGRTFGMQTSLNIYRTLGAGAVSLAQRNPYALCQVRGIGFRRADELAQSVGYGKHSPERLTSGTQHVIREAYHRDGQVYLPVDVLVERAAELLDVEREEIRAVLPDLKRSGALVSEEGRVYLHTAFALECEAANRLLNLSRVNLLYRVPNAEDAIAKTEAAEGITYSENQRSAILAAAVHPFSVITGGPGTGKTTITRALVRLFCDLGMKVCLAAPTGRAAKRMSEKAHVEARTLHRVLEMACTREGGDVRFGRNEENPLEESVFLIDEVSMVDLELLVHFLRAVRPGSRVIFIGDADQLPSVGAGNVLSDLISCGAFCVTRLDVIYRQQEESAILRYAHEVRRGAVHPLRENEGDLFYLARKDALSTADTVASLLSVRLPRRYGADSLASTQVLCPSRRGPAGSVHLNALLQEALNPAHGKKREWRAGESVFREGDRVMQIKNNYDLEVLEIGKDGRKVLTRGVFNGDIGTVERIDHAAEELTVLLEGDRRVVYPFSFLEELEHAWAITVHKSQGSEYDTVVLPLASVPPQLVRRALLYTAVTRAKTRLIVVGSRALAAQMAENDRGEERYSSLSDRIASVL